MKIPDRICALAAAVGAAVRLDVSHKHARIIFEKAGRSRFITISKSASDHRAVANQVRDARRVLREVCA